MIARSTLTMKPKSRAFAIVPFVVVGAAALGCARAAKPAENTAVDRSHRRVEVEPAGDEYLVRVYTITEREQGIVRKEVSRQLTPDVPVELAFQVRPFEGKDPPAEDAIRIVRGATDRSGVARFKLKEFNLPERFCSTRDIYGRASLTNPAPADGWESVSDFSVRGELLCPGRYAARVAAEAQAEADYKALTVDEARNVWRDPPPRAPGDAWAHAESLRKKFCDDLHPQTADGEVCFLVGANLAGGENRDEAGEYFEKACNLGFKAACDRDEVRGRIASRRRSTEEVIDGARQAVAKNLKAPSQASWGTASVVDRRGSCHLVKLTVDAPNSFGVMLHSWWLVTIARQGAKLGVVTSGAGPSSFDHEPSTGEVNIYKSMTAWSGCQ